MIELSNCKCKNCANTRHRGRYMPCLRKGYYGRGNPPEETMGEDVHKELVKEAVEHLCRSYFDENYRGIILIPQDYKESYLIQLASVLQNRISQYTDLKVCVSYSLCVCDVEVNGARITLVKHKSIHDYRGHQLTGVFADHSALCSMLEDGGYGHAVPFLQSLLVEEVKGVKPKLVLM